MNKPAEVHEVPAKASNSEADHTQMNVMTQAAAAGREADKAQEQRRALASKVQAEQAAKQGTEVVYKKDEK